MKKASLAEILALAPDHLVPVDVRGRRLFVRPPTARQIADLVRRHPSAAPIFGSTCGPSEVKASAAFAFLRLVLCGSYWRAAFSMRRVEDVHEVARAAVQNCFPDISACLLELKPRKRKPGEKSGETRVVDNSRSDPLVHLFLLAGHHCWDRTPAQLVALDALDTERRRVSAALTSEATHG